MAEKRSQNEDEYDRDEWANPAEFFLTMIANIVGAGNIIRFPYLCMRYGGGAFLVAYFTCLFLCGLPLFNLELTMGQSTQKSCLGVWDAYLPILRGVGYTTILASTSAVFYLQAVLGWIVYYFYQSLALELPWTTCNATWNTPNCVLTVGNVTVYREEGANSTAAPDTNVTMVETLNSSMSAAEEYYQNHVLQLSSGIDRIGGLNWKLCVSHIVAWIIMTLCLIKGIKTAGKVVWFSALAPYVLLTAFLIRAALLPGFVDGVHYYVTFDSKDLANAEVWLMAFLQIFYTVGPGWGGIVTMAAHNKYKHNFLIEGIFCPIICCLTSFFGGFSTFGAAGYLAYKKGLPVEQAMKTGPGMAFITYPELAAHLPAGPVWSALFFFMMFTILLDTLLVTIETVIQSVCELFALPIHKHKYVLFTFAFLNVTSGLIFYSQAGMYIYQLVDWYAFALSLALITAFECLCVTWFYGFGRFYNDIRDMIGPQPFMIILMPTWAVVVPILLTISMIWSVAKLSKPYYGSYQFPDWAATVGWVLAFANISPAVIWPIYKIISITGPGFREEFFKLLQPNRPAVKTGEYQTTNNGETDVV